MKDYTEIVQSKRDFFNNGYTRNIDFRKNVLKALKNSIKNNKQEIIDALKADFGKPEVETSLSEIITVISDIDYFLKNISRLSRPKRVGSSLFAMPSHGKVYPEPYGVTLIISPWNYPFYLAISPLVAAIAAGNCAVVKPSELTPNTSQIIYKIIDELFEPDFISIEVGGIETSQNLLDQKFDYIFFTGGTDVGKIVMEKASKYLTPVTLELGGKNPCIIDKTSDLDIAAKRIVWGKYINAGQTCVAPDYLYVENSVKDKLIINLKDEIEKSYGTTPIESDDLAKIINDKHFDRLVDVLKCGNIIVGGGFDKSIKKISPTIITDVLKESIADTQEIFGPILILNGYDNIDEVINEINSKEHPLALYVFSKDKKLIKKVMTMCQFGGGAVNDTVMQLMSNKLPFGGIGGSGMGQYHGKYGFETFTHYKGVLYRKGKIEVKQKYPPYTDKTKNLINKLI